jgi:hypothetical protein
MEVFASLTWWILFFLLIYMAMDYAIEKTNREVKNGKEEKKR